MASEVALYIDQGISFSQQMTINDDSGNPVDLSNATIICQMRRSYNSSTFYNFTINIVDAVNGVISLNLPSDQSQFIPAGRYVYDAIYTIGIRTIKIIKGTVTVYPNVSKVGTPMQTYVYSSLEYMKPAPLVLNIPEEDIMFSKRIDFVNDNILYRGEAPVGTLDTTPLWRIRKIIFDDGDGDDVKESWADGSESFTKIWTNRLNYNYF